MTQQGAGYYDSAWQRIVTWPTAMGHVRMLARAVAPWASGNVLDLGCGLGLLAHRLMWQEYLGVDHSPVAVEWARANCPNAHARFEVGDILAGSWGTWDTVALVEVLEHVDDPAAVLAVARRHAAKRVVVTVPVNIPDPAHVTPSWSQGDIFKLMPSAKVGPILNRAIWLVIEDVERAGE